MAGFLEQNDCTSIQQRLRETAERLGDVDKLLQPVAGVPGDPALGVSVRHYMGLVDCTGRVMHPTKPGKIEGIDLRCWIRWGFVTTSKEG